MIDDKVAKQYEAWGIDPPTSDVHGTDEDIRAKMTKLLPNSWHLEGNQLTGMTEMGQLTQTIPVEYILIGTDEAGLPIFRRVVI